VKNCKNGKVWKLVTLVTIFLFLIIFPSIPAPAQDKSQLDTITVTDRQLEERLAIELGDYGHSVTIVTGEELEASGYQTLSQALSNLVPGLYIRNSTRARSSMRLNGTGNFLVLLDGVRLNSRMFGSPPDTVDATGLQIVDHIEVLSGGEGLFYGTDTTGGVINIVTKRPTAEASGQVALKYGSFDAKDGSIYLSKGIEGNKFLLYGHIEDVKGYIIEDRNVYINNNTDIKDLNRGIQRSNFGIKFSRDVLDGNASIEASFLRNDFVWPEPQPSLLYLENDGYEHVAYLKWTHNVSDNYSYYLKFYFHEWWADYTQIAANGNYVAQNLPYGFKDMGINWLNSYHFDQGTEILFGGEFQAYEGLDEVMDVPQTPTEKVTAGFISFRPYFSFFPDWKTAFGVRYDNMVESSSTIWNISTKLPVFVDWLHLGANVGTTFKLPTSQHLYSSLLISDTLGNPDLKAQSSIYGTVSLLGEFEKFNFELTGFYSKTRDKIDDVPGSGPNGETMYQNVPGDTIAKGLTVSAGIGPFNGFTAKASYTVQTENVNGIKTKRPTWAKDYGTLNLRWDGRISDKLVGIGLYNTYTGEQWYNSEKKYGNYIITDANIYFNPTDKFRISLEMTNIFNNKKAYTISRLRPTTGSPLADLAEPNGYYYYQRKMTPFSINLMTTYTF
jgi:outer membrane cobalamin receptor